MKVTVPWQLLTTPLPPPGAPVEVLNGHLERKQELACSAGPCTAASRTQTQDRWGDFTKKQSYARGVIILQMSRKSPRDFALNDTCVDIENAVIVHTPCDEAM